MRGKIALERVVINLGFCSRNDINGPAEGIRFLVVRKDVVANDRRAPTAHYEGAVAATEREPIDESGPALTTGDLKNRC
jgi:hypothetical protein